MSINMGMHADTIPRSRRSSQLVSLGVRAKRAHNVQGLGKGISTCSRVVSNNSQTRHCLQGNMRSTKGCVGGLTSDLLTSSKPSRSPHACMHLEDFGLAPSTIGRDARRSAHYLKNTAGINNCETSSGDDGSSQLPTRIIPRKVRKAR